MLLNFHSLEGDKLSLKSDIIQFTLERVKFNSLKRLVSRVTPMKCKFHSFTLTEHNSVLTQNIRLALQRLWLFKGTNCVKKTCEIGHV